MNVTMTHRGTCALCRCRIDGISVASVRVNKHSLRWLHIILSLIEPRCPECRWPACQDNLNPWALDAESRAAVDAARARRGWA